MSGAVTQAIATGFYGKVPARGDFVRFGLPRDFVDAWDGWLSGVMSTGKDRAGAAWLPAFLEAPVWRFGLPPGLCGTSAVLGLTMPSVDRAGRYFPLTFAVVHDGPGLPVGAPVDAWLDRCEDAGRAALEQDLDPDRIMAMLLAPDLGAARPDSGQSEWWTEGSPRLAPVRKTWSGLPDADDYLEMMGLASLAD